MKHPNGSVSFLQIESLPDGDRPALFTYSFISQNGEIHAFEANLELEDANAHLKQNIILPNHVTVVAFPIGCTSFKTVEIEKSQKPYVKEIITSKLESSVIDDIEDTHLEYKLVKNIVEIIFVNKRQLALCKELVNLVAGTDVRLISLENALYQSGFLQNDECVAYENSIFFNEENSITALPENVFKQLTSITETNDRPVKQLDLTDITASLIDRNTLNLANDAATATNILLKTLTSWWAMPSMCVVIAAVTLIAGSIVLDNQTQSTEALTKQTYRKIFPNEPPALIERSLKAKLKSLNHNIDTNKDKSLSEVLGRLEATAQKLPYGASIESMSFSDNVFRINWHTKSQQDLSYINLLLTKDGIANTLSSWTKQNDGYLGIFSIGKEQ